MRASRLIIAVVVAAPWLPPATLAQDRATFPEIEISKAASIHEWPFAVDRGTLTCVQLGETMTVIFAEPWRTDVPQEIGNMTLPRSVVVSANPLALLASLEDRDLFLPFDSLETLVVRLAPFETMGRKLCIDAAGGKEN